MLMTGTMTNVEEQYKAVQVISELSCSDAMRCPLPHCISSGFNDWRQVGDHLLSHLPPVYMKCMGSAFR